MQGTMYWYQNDRDDYYALIINGKKIPSVPFPICYIWVDDPHTVEYQIYS